MKRKSKLLLTAIILTALALLYTAAVRLVDVQPVGPAETSVGFARINSAIAGAIGTDENGFTYSEKMYDLTEKVGLVSFLWVGAFALMGLIQLIKRKNLLKVDPEILAAGILYVLTGVIYVLFLKITVNARPVIMPGETVPEASFPSSHTIQSLVIWLSAAAVIGRYVKNKTFVKVLRVVLPLIACVFVLGRAFSGVHWATDIIGGVIYAAALLAWFAYFLFTFKKMRVSMAKKHVSGK